MKEAGIENLADDPGIPELNDQTGWAAVIKALDDLRPGIIRFGLPISIEAGTGQFQRDTVHFKRQMVDEIHRHNHKAILIYFGGVMDRLEQVASTGADGLSVEASMKNYTNDIEKIAEIIGKQITLFGNIDPIGVLQNGSDEELAREIQRQAEAGKKCRGFVMCTGSPITPATPLARVRLFIDLSQNIVGETCS